VECRQSSIEKTDKTSYPFNKFIDQVPKYQGLEAMLKFLKFINSPNINKFKNKNLTINMTLTREGKHNGKERKWC
jgi:hypothetical protein